MRLFKTEGELYHPLMYLAAYDDGDIKRIDFTELHNNEVMKMLVAANDSDGGVVANQKGLPRAEQLTWYKKSRGDPIPMGVLLVNQGDQETVAGEKLWWGHIVDAEVLKKLEESSQSRGRNASAQSVQDRLAFSTFRRGDELHHAAGEESDPSPNLCVYGVVYKAKEGVTAADQGRKMLVIFDIDLGVFFLGKWTNYKRVAKQANCANLNDNDKVEVVTSNVLKSMERAFAVNTELHSIKSWNYAVKLAETSVPPSVKAHRSVQQKEAAARDKAARDEKKKAEREREKKQRQTAQLFVVHPKAKELASPFRVAKISTTRRVLALADLMPRCGSQRTSTRSHRGAAYHRALQLQGLHPRAKPVLIVTKLATSHRLASRVRRPYVTNRRMIPLGSSPRCHTAQM